MQVNPKQAAVPTTAPPARAAPTHSTFAPSRPLNALPTLAAAASSGSSLSALLFTGQTTTGTLGHANDTFSPTQSQNDSFYAKQVRQQKIAAGIDSPTQSQNDSHYAHVAREQRHYEAFNQQEDLRCSAAGCHGSPRAATDGWRSNSKVAGSSDDVVDEARSDGAEHEHNYLEVGQPIDHQDGDMDHDMNGDDDEPFWTMLPPPHPHPAQPQLALFAPQPTLLDLAAHSGGAFSAGAGISGVSVPNQLEVEHLHYMVDVEAETVKAKGGAWSEETIAKLKRFCENSLHGKLVEMMLHIVHQSVSPSERVGLLDHEEALVAEAVENGLKDPLATGYSNESLLARIHHDAIDTIFGTGDRSPNSRPARQVVVRRALELHDPAEKMFPTYILDCC
ncbi:hypothetical protein BCR44DRAFT_1280855 [Catenaria anguillulae PL171]|uniref:Uncharacterized protein n=1 Tax=Catenaria anguillulae PL171 TaxID=765915 RepID=A0A1Y2HVU3_9FUNG|nr:hypothetical protein BCR44DRAFT_1280855 [Catenaria anguillulae PL171]